MAPGMGAAAWPAALRALRKTHAAARVVRSTVQNRITRPNPAIDPTNHHEKGASTRTLRSVKWVESPRGL